MVIHGTFDVPRWSFRPAESQMIEAKYVKMFNYRYYVSTQNIEMIGLYIYKALSFYNLMANVTIGYVLTGPTQRNHEIRHLKF
jgi:hypothetical protein